MNPLKPRVYRFFRKEHWEKCVLHRFDILSGALTAVARLSEHARQVGPAPAEGIPAVAIDPRGEPFWLTHGSVGPGRSPRIVADRESIWYFIRGGTTVERADSETLTLELSVDALGEVRDIASDGAQGVWILTKDRLVHFDCRGCTHESYPLPCGFEDSVALVSVLHGSQLALLTKDAPWLGFVDAATGRVLHQRNVGGLAPCWHVALISADTRNRIALWGPQKLRDATSWALVVLDASGDVVDGPTKVTFDGAPPDIQPTSTAIFRQNAWFGGAAGLWRLDPEKSGERETEGVLLTPALFSPDRGNERGWLRAEASIKLDKGAALEVRVAITDKDEIARDAQRIAADASLSSEQKQERIWELFDPKETKQYHFPGPASAETPIAIPMMEPRKRWAWLRIAVLTPPDVRIEPLQELRVLYPELSIGRDLPAAFHGGKNDPTGTLRGITGVLESTTQRLDQKIQSITSYLDPAVAPDEWLNYLSRWFDLPWDDDLPRAVKQSLIRSASELIEHRGTRRGLTSFLKVLVGAQARVEVADMTVDYPPMRLVPGGVRLPALLAGVSNRTPILGVKAALGRARLCCPPDPLAAIAPELRITVTASDDTRLKMESFIRRLLLQYVPAGVALSIRWRSPGSDPTIGEDGLVLDDNLPRALGNQSRLGNTLVGGKNRGRLDDVGLTLG